MRIFCTLICIVSALIAGGNCLKCAECLGLSSKPCSEPVSECPASADRCKTISDDVFTPTTNRTRFILRYCGNNSMCDVEQVLRYKDRETLIRTSCCDEDTCTPRQKQTDRNTSLNGLECPTCYEEMVKKCERNGTVQCQGDERYCVNTHMVIKAKGMIFFSAALKGCTNGDGCTNMKHSAHIFTVLINNKCSKIDL
ncbi:phospholipase A2 inhibitor and Ly6/PLAUR domain-containing protein-like [Discoglossus pictus]